MRAVRRIFGIDGGLVLSTCALLLVGIYVLSVAIVRVDGSVDRAFEYRQMIFAVIGIAIAIGMSRVPIGWWARWWPHLTIGTIIACASVRFIGSTVNGAKSWIDFGPVSLQPSEFGKVAMLIAGAGFLATRQREIRELKTFILTLALLGVPAMVVLAQPDFGTAQLYGWLAIGLLFFAGTRWTHLLALGGILVTFLASITVILPAVGLDVVPEEQMTRLTGFLDPEANALGSNYQAQQAKIAIGSGQLLGRPDDQPTQVQQGFLPEPQTDYIFAVIVEKWGFLGGAALLGLYLLFLSRVAFAVGAAESQFARLIAGGALTLFGAQIFINIGVVVGVLPVTGVTLPFVSYGGSSLWTSMALIGLVLGVLRETQGASARYQRRTGRPAAGFGSLRAAAGERPSFAPPANDGRLTRSSRTRASTRANSRARSRSRNR